MAFNTNVKLTLNMFLSLFKSLKMILCSMMTRSDHRFSWKIKFMKILKPLENGWKPLRMLSLLFDVLSLVNFLKKPLFAYRLESHLFLYSLKTFHVDFNYLTLKSTLNFSIYFWSQFWSWQRFDFD